MVKSILAQFHKEHPEAYRGDNPFIDTLHKIEDQERMDASALQIKRRMERQVFPYLQPISSRVNISDASDGEDKDHCFLGYGDYFQMFLGLHEKQEREIQRREGEGKE